VPIWVGGVGPNKGPARRDWSRPDEREADHRAIPGAQLRIIQDAGHFVSLDAPADLARAVIEFVAANQRAGPP